MYVQSNISTGALVKVGPSTVIATLIMDLHKDLEVFIWNLRILVHITSEGILHTDYLKVWHLFQIGDLPYPDIFPIILYIRLGIEDTLESTLVHHR